MAFAGFLAQRKVAGNGRDGAALRPMRGMSFVMDTCRALYEWAADKARGALIAEDFSNPFRRPPGSRRGPPCDPLTAPDITMPMAVDLVGASDAFQLRLLAPMLLFGLRASEPRFLCGEHLADGWLRVACVPELNVWTKGRRDKRFPLVTQLQPFWDFLAAGKVHGLLYERRAVVEGRESAPLRGAPLAALTAEYQRRCAAVNGTTAASRLRLRDAVLREAGGLGYDHVQGEFERLARRLGWPPEATLKDMRHNFATAMNNDAMPEAYRKYLMGHVPDKAAINCYTHLDALGRHFSQALHREWEPLVETINRRAAELSDCASRT
jgi:hypothetical protein